MVGTRWGDGKNGWDEMGLERIVGKMIGKNGWDEIVGKNGWDDMVGKNGWD
jgi:hypothetical protein